MKASINESMGDITPEEWENMYQRTKEKEKNKNIKKFEKFLESLKGYEQDSLIESIKKGFQACFEGDWSEGKENVKKAMDYLGWQGGTVHQVSAITGLSVEQIINADNIELLLDETEWFDSEGNLKKPLPRKALEEIISGGINQKAEENAKPILLKWIQQLNFRVPIYPAHDMLSQWGESARLDDMSHTELASNVLWIAALVTIHEGQNWKGMADD